jgi:S1-C subfamily serine protease
MLTTIGNSLRMTLATMLVMFALLAADQTAEAAETEQLDAGVVKLEVKPRGGGHRVGSGFIVRCDHDRAYIVTAYHVIKASEKTGVVFSSRRRAEPVTAKLIDQQRWDNGLALLSVPAAVARSAGAHALPLSA